MVPAVSGFGFSQIAQAQTQKTQLIFGSRRIRLRRIHRLMRTRLFVFSAYSPQADFAIENLRDNLAWQRIKNSAAVSMMDHHCGVQCHYSLPLRSIRIQNAYEILICFVGFGFISSRFGRLIFRIPLSYFAWILSAFTAFSDTVKERWNDW